MTITLQNVPRKDTRGLPEGMDPEQLFRYRYDTLAKGAVGVESWLYKYIPYSLVKSVAFAIDPTYRFKVAPSTITAANRTKYRSMDSVLNRLRTQDRNHYLVSWSQLPNYNGQFFCGSPFLVYTVADNSHEIVPLAGQDPLVDYLSDTTRRTRLVGSEQGELEMFKSRIFSPPRTNSWIDEVRKYTTGIIAPPECLAVGGMRDYETGSLERWTTTIGPSAARLSRSTLDSFQNDEINFCKELSKQKSIGLLKDVSPFSRDYSLSRNVAELKDLPRSMASMRKTADDLKSLYNSLRSNPKTRDSVFDLANRAAGNLPSEYLSFHFGWKQLYKDLQDLLHLPEKLSREINRLILRSGKATTWRRKKTTLSGATGLSGFEYETHSREFPNPNGQVLTTRVSRESETRLVINATFDFPPANVTNFRQNLFLDKVGLIPRFTDVYNIIPWSWLVDWFTGFGNYLELIEEINHDPSLINWGMITTRTVGKLTTEFISDAPTILTVYQDNVEQFRKVNNVLYPHSSVLEYECQTRQNVANVLDVKRTTNMESLTPYQLSILGALLAQRIDNTRPIAFR